MSEAANTQEELARRIVTELVANKLISASHEQQVLTKLTAGKAEAEDWTLWIDMASDQTSELVSERGSDEEASNG